MGSLLQLCHNCATKARSPSPDDLDDLQWQILAPLIPGLKPGGRPGEVDIRWVLNAIFYLLRVGCAGLLLPYDYPPWQEVYYYFRMWCIDGTGEKINTALGKNCGQSKRERNNLMWLFREPKCENHCYQRAKRFDRRQFGMTSQNGKSRNRKSWNKEIQNK
mgnify:CR=1 FL=1